MGRILPILLLFLACGLAAAGLGGCAAPLPEARPAPAAPQAWCYVSLAARECYAHPVPGQGYRLAGSRATEPR